MRSRVSAVSCLDLRILELPWVIGCYQTSKDAPIAKVSHCLGRVPCAAAVRKTLGFRAFDVLIENWRVHKPDDQPREGRAVKATGPVDRYLDTVAVQCSKTRSHCC